MNKTVIGATDVAPENTDKLRQTVNRYGICVGSPDPDAWFPPEPTQGGAEHADAVEARRAAYEQTALNLCGDCPVRAECLTLALHEEDELPRSWIHGVRGGTAPWQRWQMRRYRRRVARLTRQEVA
jgi:hypothetical protein